MTDARSPDDVKTTGLIGEEELVPADDAIIGRAFAWSVIVLAAVALAVGATVWALNRPEVVAPVKPAVLVPPKPQEAPALEVPAIPFVDITQEAGIDFARENGAAGDKLLPETMGGGCAFFDYNDDGLPDILLINALAWSDAAGAPAATRTTVAR